MSLCLTITSYHKITPGQCPEKLMDQGMMAIGRSSDNDWVLPDPERLVSARHCVIQYKDGRYYLTDNSTNGVELVRAGIRMRRGNSEPLEDGEVIRIGDYEISARIDFSLNRAQVEAFSGDSSNSFEALMGRQAVAPTPIEPIAMAPVAHFQGASAQDTFPDLFDFLTPSATPAATQPDHVPAEQHDFRPPTPTAVPQPVPPPQPLAPQGGALIPEDWDLFGDTPARPIPAPAPVPEAAPLTAPVAPDPFAGIGLFGAEPPQPQPQPQPRPVEVAAPPLAVAAVAPPPTAQAPQAPVAAPAPAPVAPQVDLLQAFLRGAGLDQLRIDPQQAQAQMESLGRSYRLMVEGLIDVLRARSSLKGEFRMQQTMIRPVENNPLKFAPNVDEAMLLLLRHSNQAFMAPDQAVQDSFDDLRAHQLAVMAGVEAAIKHLLGRFEPAELEARMARPGGLGNLFSGSRQAQNWQQFTALYKQISQEAQDDFQDLFGREFSRAYEEHTQRLRRS
ncbi:type VI secretion system-associated FHA domain protein TagH [Pseudomonas sp. TKO26]|uniref:type VI secretion system-associated FHA domain protein TagH n=1 Tax=unclassified Pseudomonas TaxID=196821 RepID=UPI000D98E718|nr:MULTISPECIES: type VI secretion system-associated FHA domain protein TagH [unclassified Pseudomonas]PYY86524.1 type VI secretion system-associated FHA domain protein TagH [Pseudomonas sp. TKO30]PYY89275.1 type VI secretion system-associated FHA domain protein TagH [Pseudomonas sp. TKO29]PYY91948.1 type VI secretion system-associated FHA domain protein TagH [Pseudomonas sp. TKO26]